jgi:hypothetical protein
MKRAAVLIALGLVLLTLAPAGGSPVQGHHWAGRARRGERTRVQPGAAYTFTDTFRGNERACVMVEGDHKPVTNITVVVKDLDGNVVAEDKAGGDFVTAIWYPPRTQAYTVVITFDGNEYNDLDIVVK